MAKPKESVDVRLADWRMSAFDAHMSGVKTVTRTPQTIAASKREELERRASNHGIRLEFSQASTDEPVENPDENEEVSNGTS